MASGAPSSRYGMSTAAALEQHRRVIDSLTGQLSSASPPLASQKSSPSQSQSTSSRRSPSLSGSSVKATVAQLNSGLKQSHPQASSKSSPQPSNSSSPPNIGESSDIIGQSNNPKAYSPPSSAIAVQSNSFSSLSIRQEIQRFESVHPSIYAVFDLLDLIPDYGTSQQIREHMSAIEDVFINGQEWTLSRSVPDLRIGILGTASSGKSDLVHRFLTGSYLQTDSPEGGRFKKEITIDGRSYLLLIRDEAASPELQFSGWVDAVVIVFNVDSEESFAAIPSFFSKLCHHRNPYEIPVILVGTQDSVSDSSPRVIDSSRAEAFAAELHPNCSYFETCATYGYNVDVVFIETCKKIIQLRQQQQQPAHIIPRVQSRQANRNVSPPSTSNTDGSCISKLSITSTSAPSTAINKGHVVQVRNNPPRISNPLVNARNTFDSRFSSPASNNQNNTSFKVSSALTASLQGKGKDQSSTPSETLKTSNGESQSTPSTPATLSNAPSGTTGIAFVFKTPTPIANKSATIGSNSFHRKSKSDLSSLHPSLPSNVSASKDKDSTTPSSTPSVLRKNKRRSHIFQNLTGGGKKEEKNKEPQELGSGRAIPVRQGYLYKKSLKSLNKDWKKKYVTLTSDGTLTYHPTLHDYMNNINGKEIPLKHTTVKVPGSKFKFSKATQNFPPGQNSQVNNIPSSNGNSNGPLSLGADENQEPSSSKGKKEKKHRRTKSNVGKHSEEESDGAEFTIVSLENKEWRFDAESSSERKGWVAAIEEQILSSLQGMESDKTKHKTTGTVDRDTLLSIRSVPGNDRCADCDQANPVWASLNLGTLICIECSGIHRNLGTHISKVRSLELDDWSPAHVAVMMSLGNGLVNDIFEVKIPQQRTKPTPHSSRDEKERWIRSKYELKEFVLQLRSSARLEIQLTEAIASNDIQTVVLLLTHRPLLQLLSGSQTQANRISPSPASSCFPLHLAASKGYLAICQFLIWNNIDINAPDSEGRTAFSYASSNGHKNIEDLLKSHGATVNPVNVHENHFPDDDELEGGFGQQHLAQQQNRSSKVSFVRRSLKHVLTPRAEETLSKLPSSDI